MVVPTRMAESTLRILRKLQLVDNRFALGRTYESVLIPLVREPSHQEMFMLKEHCEDARIQEASFIDAKTRPRNIHETLRGQVPLDLIPNLPRSFDTIGDIAVVELRGGLDKYSSTIGNAILKINPQLRLVLRKSSEILGTFRTRKFEVLAGVGSTETVYREFSCRFHLDVATVYFNPRLSHERLRVAEQVRSGECIVDMFAGVGPYSILIAKTQPHSKVYSIDINPAAFRYLKENVLLNGVADRVVPVLGDARRLAAKDLRGVASRIVMNLPSQARNFLDTALQLLGSSGGMIHYYTFASRDENILNIEDDVRSAVETQGMTVQSFPYRKVIKEIAPNRVQVAIDALVK